MNRYAIFILAALCAVQLEARQPTTRVNPDTGNDRVYISVKVDSMTPVSPFVGVTFGASVDAKESFHRETVIINPSSTTWKLYIASSPQSFPHLPRGTSQYFPVEFNWGTLNSTTFYMLYEAGAPTATVRGYINKEK